MLNQASLVQSLDEVWEEELPTKSKKGKHKARDFDQDTQHHPFLEAQKTEKRDRKESQKLEREQAARAMEQQEAMLVGTSGSRAPIHTKGTTPITEVFDVLTTPLSFE